MSKPGTDTAWVHSARCAGMDVRIFFPHDSVGVNAARGVCAKCPVMDECYEYAIEHRIDQGIWGGSSERERQRAHREKRSSSSFGT